MAADYHFGPEFNFNHNYCWQSSNFFCYRYKFVSFEILFLCCNYNELLALFVQNYHFSSILISMFYMPKCTNGVGLDHIRCSSKIWRGFFPFSALTSFKKFFLEMLSSAHIMEYTEFCFLLPIMFTINHTVQIITIIEA